MLLAILLPVLAQSAVFPITPGSYEGNINATTFSTRYQVTLPAGQTMTVDMHSTSGDLDPLLLLFDSQDVLLLTNDDYEENNRNARLVYTSETTATYMIEATRFEQESGTTRGTYRLTLAIAGSETVTTVDPLSIAPAFGVPYTRLDYNTFGADELTEPSQKVYYALGGQQGDFVRLVMAATTGDLNPTAAILNSNLTIISRIADSDEGEITIYAALPETGWYLIEAGSSAGIGRFTVYATRLAGAVIKSGETLTGNFAFDTNIFSYIFNATIGDRIFASVAADIAGQELELTIFDLSLAVITERTATTNLVRVPSVIIPRSGPYILQVRSTGRVRGTYTLNLRTIPVDVSKLNVETAAYNSRTTGILSDTNSMNYYRISGKAGELVTIAMNTPDNQLDPYLILMDNTLTELAFNDNAGVTRNARIPQFRLPEDGDYYVLATRNGLSRGDTVGDYELLLTVGELSLAAGSLTITLRWVGDADLNLFVRDPAGQIVSWSNPTVASGGLLQIDSNTGCDTLSTQPLEHIYWVNPTLASGDYTVWVWYQNVCTRQEPTLFALEMRLNGESLLLVENQTVAPYARFEASVRVFAGGGAVVNRGSISNPSAQQQASQGGDTLILYSQSLTGTINGEVYARFYQFQGSAGDTVAIRVERLTGTLDPIVVLRDANERNLALNDDLNALTQNSRLIYTLPYNGRYVIAVTRYGLRDGTTTGDFRLTLDLTEE
jgi:hypothetical protein